MPPEIIHTIIALAFLAISIMAGEIMVRKRRVEREISPPVPHLRPWGRTRTTPVSRTVASPSPHGSRRE